MPRRGCWHRGDVRDASNHARRGHRGPAGIASAESFGTPVLSVGPVTITPSGTASGESFGTPVISGGVTVPWPPTAGEPVNPNEVTAGAPSSVTIAAAGEPVTVPPF